MNHQNPNLPQSNLLKTVRESFNPPRQKISKSQSMPRVIRNMGKTKGRKPHDWGY